jgi:FMN-dependent oxidoreductase (nitrilotriacetate monooxygenase family)
MVPTVGGVRQALTIRLIHRRRTTRIDGPLTPQPARQLHLNANITDAGKHPSAWRHQDDPLSFLTPQYFVEIGRIAEEATFDAVFLSDWPALAENPPTKPWQSLDPTLVLATVAAATTHLGLIGTASTTFNSPYELARRFASLDQLSGGRAAWNIVTTMHPQAASNFGLARLPDHDERYAQAGEFVDVVTKLWDSWPADALQPDRASGVFSAQPIPSIDHEGVHYRVGGPLNVPRTPQGRPVLVQAGSSEPGKDLAARWADVVFTVQTVVEDARRFYADINARAERFGRPAGSVLVLPGLFPVVGSTEEEALRRLRDFNEQLDYSRELRRLAGQLGVTPEQLSLDEPLDARLVAELGSVASSHGFLNTTVSFARESGLTIRELIDRNGGAHRMVVGTPERIADDIERWFTSRAADGFNLNFDVYPTGLQLFADHVVPELRRRGLFRREYTADTLRGQLGLPVPSEIALTAARS